MAIKKKSVSSGLKKLTDTRSGSQRLLDISHALGYTKEDNACMVSVLDRASAFVIQKIPTGIFMLDWLTHGGIPLNRITRLTGQKNVCKSTLLLKLIKNAQTFCRWCSKPIVISPDTGKTACGCPEHRVKLDDPSVLSFVSPDMAHDLMYGRIPEGAKSNHIGVYVEGANGKRSYLTETYRCEPIQTLVVETEHKMDISWVRQLGVDPSLVSVMGNSWAEDTIDRIEKMMYSREVDLVVIDSLSMLTSRDAIEKSMEDNLRIAGSAQINKRLMQKIVSMQYSGGIVGDGLSLTCVLVSQVRTKGIGGFRTFIGASDGLAVDHCVIMDITLRQKSFEWENLEYATTGTYSFTVNKNHTEGSEGVTGTFKFYLDPTSPHVGTTDDLDNIIKYGRKVEVIQKTGKGYQVPEEFMYHIENFKTLDILRSYLEENPTVYSSFRLYVLKHLYSMRTEKKEKKKE